MKQILYISVLIVDSTFAVNPEIRIAQDFKLFNAKIIKNSFHKKDNYLTIKGGKINGIKKDMGVINSKGVIGIVKTYQKTMQPFKVF